MRPSTIPLILATLLLNACAVPHNDVMVFGTDTTVGVDISSSPEQANSPHFIVGYKRKELVYMPLFVNGVTSQLLKYKHQGFYSTGKGAQIKLPSGATSQTLSGSTFVVLPAGTLIKLDPQTELTFAQGSTLSLANNSDSITVSAGNYVDIPENSLIQDVSGVTYQGIDLHNAKYLARSNSSDGNRNTDTYSVLASFGASIKGGKDGSGVGIAQYFATGIAAQNLTREGGAELVTLQSSDAKITSALKQQVKELEQTRETLIDKIGMQNAANIIDANTRLIAHNRLKVDAIGLHLANSDASIDKNKLQSVLNHVDVKNAVEQSYRDGILNVDNISDLKSILLDSAPHAIDPIYNILNN